MGSKFVNVDRRTPMLLPADLREWVAIGDPVHLVIEAVEQMDLSRFGNQRGTGSDQYPPAMMLELLIYCYGLGIYSSRRIEAATYRDISVRYLTADTHPDHDTIATFRRNNKELLELAFVEILELAVELGVSKLGTIALDGTKLRANASSRHNRTDAQLRKELNELRREVKARVQKANEVDERETESEALPKELADHRRRKMAIEAAREAIKRRKQAQKSASPKGEVANTTDPDSRVQRSSEGFIQGYNAQMAVSAESGLIVAAQVCADNQDRHQLVPTVTAIPSCAGKISRVVADRGYDNHEQVKTVEAACGAKVFVPPQPPYECRSKQSEARRAVTQERLLRRNRCKSPLGQKLMRLRRCLVEPVFGTLKSVFRFTRFHLRGLKGANNEWKLLCLAYNVRKLHRWCLGAA